MRERTELNQQAEILCHYLVKQKPSKLEAQLYTEAVSRDAGLATKKDNDVAQFAFGHPRMIGSLDAGLALVNPNAELRRRIYIMFSILEAMPQHTNAFFPQQKAWWEMPGLIVYGIRAALKAVAGIIILKIVSLRAS